jgi:hypothetical protein
MSAYIGAGLTLTHAGDPAQIRGAVVTPGFFETLGVAPALGRTFDAREGGKGGDRVAILSHGLWQTRFGGDPAVVGRSIVLNGAPREIVGVMPASFAPRKRRRCGRRSRRRRHSPRPCSREARAGCRSWDG